jgi:hypothetical protein
MPEDQKQPEEMPPGMFEFAQQLFGAAPTEPTSDLRTGAKAMFEMFSAFQQAGFSEQQAMYLVGQIVTAGVQQ